MIDCMAQNFNAQHSTRFDLSEWVIHFVHDRKVNDEAKYICLNNPASQYAQYADTDYFENDNPQHINDCHSGQYQIPPNATAFEVLKKILHDGYIHSGWAFRDGNPTILGPSSAVCFTEMPLHALKDYAEYRRDKGYYATFCGIAFKREDLYYQGARPVIYGISRSVQDQFIHGNQHPYRYLDEQKCGIMLSEQYRIVGTELYPRLLLPNNKNIDWTFEREWRWAFKGTSIGVPGFPFLRCPRHEYFSEIMIIVETLKELTEIQDFCKALYDNALLDSNSVYNKDIFPKLRFVCKETLAYSGKNDVSSMHKVNLHQPDTKLLPNYYPDPAYDYAITVFEQAKQLYCQVIDGMSGRSFDQSLYPHTAYIYTAQFTGYTQALRDKAGFCANPHGCYVFEISSIHQIKNQNMLQVAAGAAATFLSEQLNQKFEYIVQ